MGRVLLQVSGISVQDPFVLDHNTTSNVSQRFQRDILREEFRRAAAQTRNLVDSGGNIDAQHAGIVDLLVLETSSVGSPSTKKWCSPQQSKPANPSDVAEDEPHVQLFTVRRQDSAKPTTAAASSARHSEAVRERRVEESGARWQCSLADVLKRMLTDVFDMDCVFGNRPSKPLFRRLCHVLRLKATRKISVAVPDPSQSRRLALDGRPPVAGSQNDCSTSDSQCQPDRKRRQRPVGEGSRDGIAEGGHSVDQVDLRNSSTKRPRLGDVRSDGAYVDGGLLSSGGQVSDASNRGRRPVLLWAQCSARSRLWVGRKKVRRQFTHLPDELQRQLGISSAMRNDVEKQKKAILEFEVAVVRRRPKPDGDDVALALLPSATTSKEFGCFITYFVSLLPKLVDGIKIDGPVFH